MYKLLTLLALISALTLTQSAGQRVAYYVSTSGNDAWIGTQNRPWRTIQRCADVAIAGVTCVIQPGVYNEAIVLARSGITDEPVRFTSSELHGAVIEGSVTITGSHVELDGVVVFVPSGGGQGVSIHGDYSEVSRVRISTRSTSLGLNNTGLILAGSRNRAIGNRIDRLCFGISLTGRDHLVESNDVSDLTSNGRCGDVDYLRFFGSGHVMRRNNFHGTKLEDVAPAHVDCFQTFDANGAAITAVLIEGNTCTDAHQGVLVSADTHRKSAGLVIRNNLFSRVTSWCVLNSNVADVRILNNTCDTTGGLYGLFCRGQHGTASCEFKNNIVYGAGTLRAYGAFETAVLIDGDKAAPGRSNLLFTPGETITGYSRDVLNQDPLFLRRTEGDYRLSADSPAIDAGATVAGWGSPEDMVGVRRPQGAAWDIGAFETAPLPDVPRSLRVTP